MTRTDHLAAHGTSGNVLRRVRRALSVIFLLNGMVFASWMPQIPTLRDNLGIDEGTLGLALLGPPAGFLIGTRLAGTLAERFGSGPVTRVLGTVYALCLIGPALAGTAWQLFLLLIPLGLTQGGLIVASNAHAVLLQERYGRPILTSFHAFYSMGGMAGAGLGGMAVQAGLRPLVHFTIVGLSAALAVTAAAVLLFGGNADRRTAERQDRSRRGRLPTGPVLLLSMLGFLVLVAEGETANWSAMYLRDVTGAGSGVAALGYAAFAAMMTVGRLIGDRLLAALGPVRFVRASAGLAAVGMALALWIGTTPAGIAGFAVLGLGLAALTPIIFGAAGNLPDGTRALSQVVALSFLGFLAGPPLMGVIAKLTDLRVGFAMMTVMVAVVALGARVTATAALPDSTSSQRSG